MSPNQFHLVPVPGSPSSTTPIGVELHGTRPAPRVQRRYRAGVPTVLPIPDDPGVIWHPPPRASNVRRKAGGRGDDSGQVRHDAGVTAIYILGFFPGKALVFGRIHTRGDPGVMA